MTKSIPLTQNETALVDDEDFEWLIRRKWQVTNNRGHKIGYASSFGANTLGVKTLQLMHRLIMDAPADMLVDHINHNTLDNRRENLRLCTRTENSQNQKPQIGRSSQFKGVCYDKRRGKWHTKIQANKQVIFLGLFADEVEAAKAYDTAARKYHGEFARTNFNSDR